MSELMGHRSLSKFSGFDADWADWSYEARAEFVCKGLLTDAELVVIERRADPWPMPADQRNRERASKLYYLLARSCRGAANLVLRKLQRGNGCEACLAAARSPL